MIEELGTLRLLMGPKLKGLLRPGDVGEVRHTLRVLFFAGLGLAFALAIYFGSAWLLRQCLEVELVGAFIPRRLMSWVLLILLSILLLSATISSFSVFFLSEDLTLLLSAPISLGPLYYARFLEMAFHSTWMVIFFALPVFLAYGKVYHASLSYYGGLVLLFPALILTPAALGSLVAAVLTRIFSARRSRDLLVLLVMLAFVFLYLVIRAAQPERLLEEESFGTMIEFLNMFHNPSLDYLPSTWATEALFTMLEGKSGAGLLPVLTLWFTAGAMVTLNGWVGTALYRTGFARAQEGRIRGLPMVNQGKAHERLLGRWLDRLGGMAGGFTGSILIKDVRVFFRDTNQWLQLPLLGALAAVYVLNFIYLRGARFSWFTLYTVNHVLLGLVLAGVAVRFVFPAVSLEGRAFWLIRSAPVRMPAFLHSKLLVHLVPLAGMGLLLSGFSCTVIGVPRAFTLLSMAMVLVMSLGVCTLGVGIGALYPHFSAENPAKIPSGIGGVIFMVTSMGFVIVFLLASFYPVLVLYQMPMPKPNSLFRLSWLVISLMVTVGLTMVVVWVPMVLGRKNLERKENG